MPRSSLSLRHGRDTYNILRDRFNATIDEISTWIIYTRADTRFRCTDCWKPEHYSSSPDCDTCFGTGYEVSLEMWYAAIFDPIVRAQNIPPTLTVGGMFQSNSPVIFSKKSHKPRSGDRVFSVEWNKPFSELPNGAVPTRIINSFEISRIEYYSIQSLAYYISHCTYLTGSNNTYETKLISSPIQRII